MQRIEITTSVFFLYLLSLKLVYLYVGSTKQPSVFKCDIRYSKEFRNILNMWECMHWYNNLKKNTIIQTQKDVSQGPRAFPLLLYSAQNGMFIFFTQFIFLIHASIHSIIFLLKARAKAGAQPSFKFFLLLSRPNNTFQLLSIPQFFYIYFSSQFLLYAVH